MDISSKTIRIFNARTGASHYTLHKLPDGSASTGNFPHHNGPDYKGSYADVSPRPLTGEEWEFINNGGTLSFVAGRVYRQPRGGKQFFTGETY